MANQRHLELLGQGCDRWGQWRKAEPHELPDLRCADLRGAKLNGFDFSHALLAEADLTGADLRGARFEHAKLSFSKYMYPFPDERVGAKLTGADARHAAFHYADLTEVDLIGTNLRKAVFTHANLHAADLSNADLSGASLLMADLTSTRLTNALLANANLEYARLNRCILDKATIAGARVYGISVWDVDLTNCNQSDLIISKNPYPQKDTAAITVDSLELAQFMYLLLSSSKLRDVIDTVTSKVVLLLGRFSPSRKQILDAVRDRLRLMNFVPVLFDFDQPNSKDVTGTVETLARMARFIIVDLTDPSSVPHELATIVPFLRTTPVLPLRQADTAGYSMFADLQRAYPWVLPLREYADERGLISQLSEIIAPAEQIAVGFRARQ